MLILRHAQVIPLLLACEDSDILTVRLCGNRTGSTSEGKKSSVEPVINPDAPDGWRIEVCTGALSKVEEERQKAGTKAGRGQFSCLLTGVAIGEEYNRAQGATGQLGERLLAIMLKDRLADCS